MATAELSNWRSWQNWRPFEHFKGDLTGGLTAAVVALPLALAFAVASGVEPKAGLYTAIAPMILSTYVWMFQPLRTLLKKHLHSCLLK
jgi:sulfate permease, SulP family